MPQLKLPALTRFLANTSGAGRTKVAGLRLLSRGTRGKIWSFEATFSGGPMAGTRRLVLRTDELPGIAFSLSRIEEFAVLRAAFDAGVPVPEPMWACADPDVIGAPFFVMRHLPGIAQAGRVAMDRYSGSAPLKIVAQLGPALARLQAVRPPRPDLAFLPLVGPEQFIASFLRYLRPHLNQRPRLRGKIHWLESHIPEPLPVVLCHRDFRIGNFLFEAGALTGILDFEFAGWGDPDEDIGRLFCMSRHFPWLELEVGGSARTCFCRAYQQASGRDVEPARLQFWEELASVRRVVIALLAGDDIN